MTPKVKKKDEHQIVKMVDSNTLVMFLDKRSGGRVLLILGINRSFCSFLFLLLILVTFGQEVLMVCILQIAPWLGEAITLIL